MNTQIEERTDRQGASRMPWRAVTAVAVAIVVVVAAVVALGRDPAPQAAPLELSAGGGETLASCIAFSPEELAKVAEIAFEGTVASVDGPTVRLSVDHWFKGDETSEVVLHAPQGMEALIGGIPFVAGDQYLISAQGGNVNYCGFSGPSTPEYRSSFEQAFRA